VGGGEEEARSFEDEGEDYENDLLEASEGDHADDAHDESMDFAGGDHAAEYADQHAPETAADATQPSTESAVGEESPAEGSGKPTVESALAMAAAAEKEAAAKKAAEQAASEAAEKTAKEKEELDRLRSGVSEYQCDVLAGGKGNAIRSKPIRKLRSLVQHLRRRLFSSDVDGAQQYVLDECLDRAKKARDQLDAGLKAEETTVTDLKTAVHAEYGPDLALRALRDECFKKSFAQFSFEHCFFDNIKQYEGTKFVATIGSFKESTVDHSGVTRLMYDNGDRCWGGPQRSLGVELQCGETNEIVTVDEPSKCVYAMVFRTPAACTQAMLDPLEQQLGATETQHDEL